MYYAHVVSCTSNIDCCVNRFEKNSFPCNSSLISVVILEIFTAISLMAFRNYLPLNLDWITGSVTGIGHSALATVSFGSIVISKQYHRKHDLFFSFLGTLLWCFSLFQIITLKSGNFNLLFVRHCLLSLLQTATKWLGKTDSINACFGVDSFEVCHAHWWFPSFDFCCWVRWQTCCYDKCREECITLLPVFFIQLPANTLKHSTLGKWNSLQDSSVRLFIRVVFANV